MTYLVPYDGSDLAKAALAVARDHARADGHDLVAVVVIPRRNARYAREKGWIDEDEEFDQDAIESALEREARSIAPEVGFKVTEVDRFGHRARIANAVGRVAARIDVHTVYIGSERAGASVVPTNSVGGDIAGDPDVDVHVVRDPEELARRSDRSGANEPVEDRVDGESAQAAADAADDVEAIPDPPSTE